MYMCLYIYIHKLYTLETMCINGGFLKSRYP